MTYRKYLNKPTIVDSITFDSIAESRRYRELKLLLDNGNITKLELQPRFTLLEAYVNGKGKKIQALYYFADFRYFDMELDRWIVEDVKRSATATPVYKLKKKLFESKFFPLTITETDA